jgi:chromosome partitioning protein
LVVRVIAIVATKGGSGKSTLSSSLAVEAAKHGKVRMIDLDPQQSLADWWGTRGEPDNPGLIDLDPRIDMQQLTALVAKLGKSGVDTVIVDTPPALVTRISAGVKVADLVLIPCRPSAFDLTAIQPCIEMCSLARVPYKLVLNQVASPKSLLRKGAHGFLAAEGHTADVLNIEIAARDAYAAAVTVGKTGPERDEKAAAEIAALWNEVAEAHDVVRATSRTGESVS